MRLTEYSILPPSLENRSIVDGRDLCWWGFGLIRTFEQILSGGFRLVKIQLQQKLQNQFTTVIVFS
jgi:hypothetical protein